MLFLSHSGADTNAARELAARLGGAGLQVWLDVEELAPGDRWMVRLEEALAEASAFAVYVGPSGIQRWVDREVRVALERNASDPDFRIIPILGPGSEGPDALPPFIAQHQAVDIRDDLSAEELKALIGAVLDRPAKGVSLLPPGQAPFRGLEYFDVEHAHLYFGRDEETQELLERLHVDRFLAVVGASGSGKSSLVRAGLIPALHRGRFQQEGFEPACWRVALCRPGGAPFRALAGALADLDPGLSPAERIRTIRECARQLQDGAEGMAACVDALVPRGHRVLLVLDQFEELFTQNGGKDEGVAPGHSSTRAFIDTLLRATEGGDDRPVHVLITLRADFYSRCWQHPDLPERIARNQHAARPLDRDQLVDIIEKPLALAGATLEEGLVDRILEDAGHEPGSLPLVEHALLLLWERREGTVLTHQAYSQIGGVSGALAHHADEVLDRMADDGEREIARKIFLRLTQPGEGTEDTRRRAGRDEITSLGSDDDLADRALQRLAAADARLVITRREAETDVVEVAHEALIREWPRLRDWIDANRAGIRTERRLIEAAADWERLSRDPQALLRGRQLEETEEWSGRDRHREDLREREQQFLDESIQARDQKILEAKQRRRRAVRQLQWTAAVLGVAFLVAAGTTIYAFRANGRAEANFDLARRAVDESLTAVDRDPHHEALVGAADPEVAALGHELLGKAQEFYGAFVQQKPEDRQVRESVASAHFNLARTNRSLDQSDAAIAEYRAAIAEYGRLLAENPSSTTYRRELANTYNWLGETLRESGAPAEEVGAAYEEALALQLELHRQDPDQTVYRRDLARSYSNRGILHWTLIEGDPSAFERSEADFREAIALLEPIADPGTNPRAAQELGRAYNNLGTLAYTEGGGLDEVRASYDRAIETHRRLVALDPDNRGYRLELVKFYHNATDAEREAGEYERALRYSSAALEIIDDLSTPAPMLLIDRADAFTLRGRIAESRGLPTAVAEYQRALDVFRGIQPDSQVWGLPEFHRRYWDLLFNVTALAETRDEEAPIRPLLTDATRSYSELANAIITRGRASHARTLLEYGADVLPRLARLNEGMAAPDLERLRSGLEAKAAGPVITTSSSHE